jgi:predicted ATP-grasp superfamily ATP-dependent carboligase
MRFPAYAILSYASTERADPRAASAAISLISEYYGFTIDTSALMKGAEVMESDNVREEPSIDKRTGDSMYT